LAYGFQLFEASSAHLDFYALLLRNHVGNPEILALEQDYGIKLTEADFANFDIFGMTFSDAGRFQEMLFEIVWSTQLLE
jgi:hypothetical protein